MKNRWTSIAAWIILSIYLYFAYHLLFTPLVLDLSYWGVMLVTGLVLLMIWSIPPRLRRNVIIYSLLFLFMDRAFYQIEGSEWSVWIAALAAIPVLLVAWLVAWGYGKLSRQAIVLLLVSGIATTLWIPRNEVPILSHFFLKWNSEPVFAGKMFDYFPLTVYDIDRDGTDEIITLGNAEEQKLILDKLSEEEALKRDRDYRLTEENLYPYVFKWNGREMERLAAAEYDLKTVLDILPKDDPAFPYFAWEFTEESHRSVLNPLTDRQRLAEGMMQFGTAPFRAMTLNIENISRQLKQSDGVLDRALQVENHPDLHDIQIKDGEVSGYLKDQFFRVPTPATKIIDGLKWGGGRNGLLVLGNDLELITISENGDAEVTHVLSRKMLKNIASSEFSVADADGDGDDEVFVSSSYSRIIKPRSEGDWEILWTATDTNFRFADFIAAESGENNELITLDQSAVIMNPDRFHLRFLTGYEWDSALGLKRDWRTFLSFIHVNAADVDGDGEEEIVASIYNTHKIYVLEKHSYPVNEILWGATFGLIIFGWTRRVRDAVHHK